MTSFEEQVHEFNKLLCRLLKYVRELGGDLTELGGRSLQHTQHLIEEAYTADPYGSLLQYIQVERNSVRMYFNIRLPWDLNIDLHILGYRFEAETSGGRLRPIQQRDLNEGNGVINNISNRRFIFERGRINFVPFAAIEIVDRCVDWPNADLYIHQDGGFVRFHIGPILDEYSLHTKLCVDKLTTVEIENKGANLEICSICCEKMMVGALIKEMPCKHLHHEECLRNWFMFKTFCPSCRHNMPT